MTAVGAAVMSLKCTHPKMVNETALMFSKPLSIPCCQYSTGLLVDL